jgi:hypothetical protein
MMTALEGMHGGLSSLADTLQIIRIGPMHQAGSDSLLTAQVFFSMLEKHFNGICDDSKYAPNCCCIISLLIRCVIIFVFRFKGELFGVGTNHTKYKSGKYSAPISSLPPSLQFSSSVHYPAAMPAALSNACSPAPGNFGYDDNY